MWSIESTSPGRAVPLGAVELVAVDAGALAGGLVDGAVEGWAAGFWALAHKEARARQTVKTAEMSFLMENNLTPIHPARKQK
jgi:hypothetical protein